MERQEVFGALRDFIVKENDQEVAVTVEDGTDLIEQGLLESLSIPRLIAAIEKMKGERASLENLTVDSFRSLDRIYAAFFAR